MADSLPIAVVVTNDTIVPPPSSGGFPLWVFVAGGALAAVAIGLIVLKKK